MSNTTPAAHVHDLLMQTDTLGNTSGLYCRICGVELDALGDTVEPATMTLTERATKLIADTYKTHGVCTLSCDCCMLEDVVIDRTAVGNAADIAKTRDLLEHTRYHHMTPRRVLATMHVVAFDTRVITHPDKRHFALQENAGAPS